MAGQNRAKVAITADTVQSIPAFWRAVSIIAEQIASLPVSVYSVDKGVITENTTHPLWRVLKVRPNQKCSRFDFFDTIVRQIFIFSAAYVWPVRDDRGAITSLEMLPIPYDFTQVDGNLYYHFRLTKNERLTLRWDEVLVFKAWSLDGMSGQAPMKILQDIFGGAIAQIQYGAAYFGNGTHVSGLLIPEQPMTPVQFQQAKEAWQAQSTGASAAGATTMLPFGVKYQAIASTLTDADFVAARNLTVQDVANITGVPVDLLNSGDKASTYASAEERTRQFVLFTLRVWAKRLEDEMNSKLFSARDQRTMYVRFNINSLLRGDMRARAEMYQTMLQNGVLTINEVRALEDFNPIDGGDELLVPMNMAPIGQSQSNE